MQGMIFQCNTVTFVSANDGKRLFVIRLGLPLSNKKLDHLLFLVSLIQQLNISVQSGGMHSNHPIKNHKNLNEEVPLPLLANRNRVTVDMTFKRQLIQQIFQDEYFPEIGQALGQLGASKDLLLLLRKMKFNVDVEDLLNVSLSHSYSQVQLIPNIG